MKPGTRALMRKLSQVREHEAGERSGLARAHKLRRKQLGAKHYTGTIKSGLEHKIRKLWTDIGRGKHPARSGFKKYDRLVKKQYGDKYLGGK